MLQPELPREDLDESIDSFARIGQPRFALTVLPLYQLDGDEKGVYSEHSIELVKLLRDGNVDVGWSQAAGSRSYRTERSTELATTILLGLAEGVAGNAIWDLMTAWLTSRSFGKVSLTVVRRQSRDGDSIELKRYKGSAEDVARLLKAEASELGARDGEKGR